jgi:hypothetical protein
MYKTTPAAALCTGITCRGSVAFTHPTSCTFWTPKKLGGGGIYARYYASLSWFLEPRRDYLIFSDRQVGGFNIWATRLINLLAPEAQVGELNICLEKGKQGQPTEQRSAMRDLVQCCVWFACLMNRIHKTHYPTPPVLGDFLGNHENRSPSKKNKFKPNRSKTVCWAVLIVYRPVL